MPPVTNVFPKSWPLHVWSCRFHIKHSVLLLGTLYETMVIMLGSNLSWVPAQRKHVAIESCLVIFFCSILHSTYYIPFQLFIDLFSHLNTIKIHVHEIIPKGNCHFYGYRRFSGKVAYASKTLVLCRAPSRFSFYLIVLNGPKPIWLFSYFALGKYWWPLAVRGRQELCIFYPMISMPAGMLQYCKSYSKFW